MTAREDFWTYLNTHSNIDRMTVMQFWYRADAALRADTEAAEARATELLRRIEDAQAHVGKLEDERDEARRRIENLSIECNDLTHQLEQAQAELAEYKRAHKYAWKNVLDDALNSGDGVYRP